MTNTKKNKAVLMCRITTRFMTDKKIGVEYFQEPNQRPTQSSKAFPDITSAMNFCKAFAKRRGFDSVDIYIENYLNTWSFPKIVSKGVSQ